MDFEKLIDNLDPAIYASLKRALEIGKWPDGRVLTDEQRAHCMDAVIAYDHRRKPEEQRVGYIDKGSKSEGDSCDGHGDNAAEKPIKWADS